jgi:predicted RNA-binding Zn ribbon-like protein
MRPNPSFLASHPALDFVNSFATPNGQAVEWLEDGASFLGWLRAAGLATDADIHSYARRFGRGQLDELAATARALREKIRAELANVTAFPNSARLRTALNRLMGAGSAYRRLERVDDQLHLIFRERSDDPMQLLIPIAEAAARLMTEEDANRIRRCAGPSCSIWFLDRTKGGTRRFCSATICGNRAKVAAFRERERAAPRQKLPR